jgi:hypothetical protein
LNLRSAVQKTYQLIISSATVIKNTDMQLPRSKPVIPG